MQSATQSSQVPPAAVVQFPIRVKIQSVQWVFTARIVLHYGIPKVEVVMIGLANVSPAAAYDAR